MIRAVAFDAVGTLLHPQPSAAEIYAEVGARFGSRLPVREIQARFRAAFSRQEALDGAAGMRTDETRERCRWQHIVAEVLDDVADPAACFAALYEHFRRPEAWRLDPEAEMVLAELRRRGRRLALASNYDERLRSLSMLFPEVDEVVISAEVGWRKPAPEFFGVLCDRLQLPAHAVAFVGDDRVNDFEGARRAGLHAVLFDPCKQAPELGPERIGNLGELLAPGRVL
jgi:putative hydrolase of the HAD superfamily